MSNKFTPETSILVSSKNRREDLLILLKSLQSLDYPSEKVEIVVVEETNSPLDIKDIRYIAIPEENRGFGYTRNIAVKNAGKEIVVFIDDDCIPEKNWLKELVRPFEDNRVMGVAGAVKVRDCNTIGYCENVLGFPGGGLKYIHHAQEKIQSTNEISTLNAAYRKDAIIQAGGFEEDTRYSGEDYLLAKLICKDNKCVYILGAIVYHKARGTLLKNLKWFIRRGRSDMGILNKLDSSQNYLWWMLRSSIFIKILIGSSLIYFLTRNSLISILLFCALYYIKNFSTYSYSYKYVKNAKVLLFTPILKFIMDIGADIGRLDYCIFEKRWRQRKNRP